MKLDGLTTELRRLLDIRAGEFRRVAFMAALLFFLLAANNVVKVVRDSLFLSRFPITQLPYVYLLAALVAGLVIVLYTRATANLALGRVMLGTLGFVISNLILFWLAIAFFEAGWVLYAYYMWSAIVGLIMVAQFWTLANELFTPREGKRLFGLVAAGGTLGGLMGGLVSSWAVPFLVGTNQLLWFGATLLAGAFAIAYLALSERDRLVAGHAETDHKIPAAEVGAARGMMGTVMGSRYLRTIAALIFVSVVVSTLIDYQFKAAAKLAYPSAAALAGFFGAYYAWLSVVTMLAQLWLTGKLLLGLGLTPSLLVLPVTLLAGSLSLLAWPGVFAATVVRMTEASLRTSVNQSSVQILYLPIADAIKKKVKVFMDVTVERLGDGFAALIILSYTAVQAGTAASPLSYFAIVLIAVWLAIILAAKAGYVDALRQSLAYRDISLLGPGLDFTDKATVDAAFQALQARDERSILVGLDLLEHLNPEVLARRLPRSLLHHESAEVRRRALTLFTRSPDPDLLAEVLELLANEGAQVQAQAITTVSAILKQDSAAVIEPYLESPEPQVRRSAIRCLLEFGDMRARSHALQVFNELVSASANNTEINRMEAARLIGELDHPEFAAPLRRLITEDPSPLVVREALAAAGQQKRLEIVPEVISRLCCRATKTAAREALVQYGESAVKELRNALYDSRVGRDVRLNIPQTLSKIPVQSAMNALMGGLLDEDRSIRFRVILAVEEMARRFTELKVDRDIVESAIMSDGLLYCHRFVVFSALFGLSGTSSERQGSLIYFALTESMERVKERVMWLLSLVQPAKDIRRAWLGLGSPDPIQRAHAIELLDNLHIGTVKKYIFNLYSDSREDQRLYAALDLLGINPMDTESGLRALLEQDDPWLRAAAIWEIGRRQLVGLRPGVEKFMNSEIVLLRETARAALERMAQW